MVRLFRLCSRLVCSPQVYDLLFSMVRLCSPQVYDLFLPRMFKNSYKLSVRVCSCQFVVNTLVPDFDFKFQLDVELFFDSLFYGIYQSHNIAAFAPLLSDNEIGVFLADDSTADLQAFKASPVNQSA